MKNQEVILHITRTKLNLKNDAEFSRAIGIPPSAISKLRHGKAPMSAALIIALHEKTDISIAELKRITGYKGLSDRLAEHKNAEQASGTKQASKKS
ncbi:MAG: helix-turn-helix domain-containing protein [Burkholderiaceae bacterium]